MEVGALKKVHSLCVGHPCSQRMHRADARDVPICNTSVVNAFRHVLRNVSQKPLQGSCRLPSVRDTKQQRLKETRKLSQHLAINRRQRVRENNSAVP